MSESEFMTKLKALPFRERKLWFDMVISGKSSIQIAEEHGISRERALEIVHEINERLGADLGP